jgi:hypothetical protein
MSVRLELKPEVEARLASRARERGLPLNAYLQSIIEDLARTPEAPAASLEELRVILDALAEMGKGLPQLPSAAFTRESIYRDRN